MYVIDIWIKRDKPAISAVEIYILKSNHTIQRIDHTNH